jgi:hypothetical protein
MPLASAPGDSTDASRGVPGAWRDTHLAAALPAGMSAEQACAGFKSKVQCAIAVHAAHNLDMPFADLKSKVTAGQKLGAMIHQLRPEAHVNREVARAEQQARGDLDLHSPSG